MECALEVKRENGEYKLVPPDGGWGYIVAGSWIIIMLVSMCPPHSFGLLYGEFLSSIDDETRATSILTSTCIAVMSFSGFASSYMLQKYSVKTVSFVGAISYTLGCLTNIFNTNVAYMVISYSILKGFGLGIMLSASFK
ncbi:hypothetical protein JTB14_033664 [Gonioctena quinquepunctata]|nr:hypothetical protein JTB14_033664 [Gonioctena quinquepunctata]